MASPALPIRQDSTDHDGRDSQIRSWGAPKPPKAPKVCDTPLETGRASYVRVLAALDERCLDHIEPNPWQRAVEDGRRFLVTWGERAQALGWTARDLFGLHEVPHTPHASYRRLARHDCTDLIWLLRGAVVVDLTESTAAICGRLGAVTTYRRAGKPAFGPLGDSLDEFQ
jgi:hypothetical protein